MKYTLLLAMTATLLAVSFSSRAQHSTEDSVRAAVNAIFTGMKEADSVGITHAFTDNGMLQAISTDANGNKVVTTTAVDKFCGRILSLGKGGADERVHIDLIKIDGDLAIAWAPYSFFLKGSFHHCGIDTFQLVRTAKGWKIQYILYNGRQTSCPVGTPDAP